MKDGSLYSFYINGGWKVMPHPERCNGPVNTYKLSPEELTKYRSIKNNRKDGEAMKLLETEKEVLEAICDEYGYGEQAIQEAVERLQLSRVDARKLIAKANKENIKKLTEGVAKNIAVAALQNPSLVEEMPTIEVKPESFAEAAKELVEEAEKIMTEKPKCTKQAVLDMAAAGKTPEEMLECFKGGWKGDPGILRAKIALYLHGEKPKKKKQNPEPAPEVDSKTDYPAYLEQELEKAIQEEKPASKSILRPRVLVGKEIEYTFEAEDIYIHDMDNSAPGAAIGIEISYEYLDLFIAELQEVNRIRKQFVEGAI